MYKLIENMFPQTLYEQMEFHARTAPEESILNPVDGVLYPHIIKSIPNEIIREFFPKGSTMFFRRSPKGVRAPNRYHNDVSQGSVSVIVYFEDDHEGGTSFVYHKPTGIACAPQRYDDLELLRADSNDLSKWEAHTKIEAKKNRALVYDTRLFHCAEPFGGKGLGESARVVFTVFCGGF